MSCFISVSLLVKVSGFPLYCTTWSHRGEGRKVQHCVNNAVSRPEMTLQNSNHVV